MSLDVYPPSPSPSSGLEISIGNVPGRYPVNKFGLTSNADANVITDVWDAPAQPVWLAPTAPRIHEILSDNDADSDTGGAVAQGAGLRTLRIWGLQTWDTRETSEDIIMDGTDGTDTVNSYVIIHRMEKITCGGSVPNIGTITAVAAVDGTITARINPIKGQTLMAILGVPSVQNFYMNNFSASIARASPVSAESGVIVRYNGEVKSNLLAFVFKHTSALNEDGTVANNRPFNPPKEFEGPCIIKMALTAKDNDTNGDASFDGVLVDN
jgi:hypothetical protein